jgi:hypothetical protein
MEKLQTTAQSKRKIQKYKLQYKYNAKFYIEFLCNLVTP